MFKSTFLFFLICFSLNSFSQNQFEKIKINKDIELVKITENAYVYVYCVNMQRYGRVCSNGLLYKVKDKAILVDLPNNDSLTASLLNWIKTEFILKIEAVAITHWHEDRMGGLQAVKIQGITSYSSIYTKEIASQKNLPLPDSTFKDSMELKLYNKSIILKYAGAGHTRDNIVVWLPREKVLFGGCLIKELKSVNLGNLADADLKAWPATIRKLQNEFESVKIIIPGHGETGDSNLLIHMNELLMQNK